LIGGGNTKAVKGSVQLVILDEVDSSILAEAASLAERALRAATTVRRNLRCEDGYDPARGQWRAEAMLERCVVPHGSLDGYAVGLTTKDLYVQSLNFVFGLALGEKKAAIVSMYRLMQGSRATVAARVAKETIHEVGHLQGLAHCEDERCVMWFSNTLAETDRKGAMFCSRCDDRRS
jgi:archaemetzincin